MQLPLYHEIIVNIISSSPYIEVSNRYNNEVYRDNDILDSNYVILNLYETETLTINIHIHKQSLCILAAESEGSNQPSSGTLRTYLNS